MKCKNRKSKTTFKVKLKNKLYAIFQKVFIYLNKFKLHNILKDKIIDIIKKYLIYIIKKNLKKYHQLMNKESIYAFSAGFKRDKRKKIFIYKVLKRFIKII